MVASRDAVAALSQQFIAANPHLAPGQCAPGEEGGLVCCGDRAKAMRVVSSGGRFTESILHPVFTPLEQLWRKFPDDGIFQASERSPSVIEIGAFRVPANQSLILGEYSFQPFRFNGVLAGDVVPLEDQRLATTFGYDLNFSQARKGHISFEILPTSAPQNSRSAFFNPSPFGTIFQGQTVGFDDFDGPLNDLYDETPKQPETEDVIYNQAQSSVQGNPAGSALIPPSGKGVQGPSGFPFTYQVDPNESVQIRVYIFRPVSVPLAFFQASISGYLVPTTRLQMLLRSVEPCW